MSYRAPKSGLAAEAQRKIQANYDVDEARRSMIWAQAITGCDEIPADHDAIDASHDNFWNTFRDGVLLCKLIDQLYPGRVNWKDKTFQTPKIEAMRVMRERERIAMFSKLVVEYGVPETYTFPTESLHEKGALNLSQVSVCFRALGIEAQSRPGYNGPEGFWPKKTGKNVREFTDEQQRAGANVIGLQMGTNKGASQAGMTMGKQRMVID